MSSLYYQGGDLASWLVFSVAVIQFLLLGNAIYNLFFHPLANVPGPFWARASGIPSWYHAMRGDRHLWLWRQFQVYGYRIRPEPNAVLFHDPNAYVDIYSMKSNVRRAPFFTAFKRVESENTTLTEIDVAKHARKRKLLALGFTDQSVRSASEFVIKHIDRWTQLITQEIQDCTNWSTPQDFSKMIDCLIFDIMGDLSFGKSFNIKEPGINRFKVIPHSITENLRFYYPICRSPFLHILLWLKPRGLNKVFELVSPPAVHEYNNFVYQSVTDRITLQRQQPERRHDMFYFLYEARDPNTGQRVYEEDELRAECSLLITAGSDTVSISLSSIFFYLTGDPQRCQKLTNEIRTTFQLAEDIVHGPVLQGCAYLRACIDEGMRLTPAVASEHPREVLTGGLRILGEYYPAGTIVGTVPWASSRDQAVYGDDVEEFRPERWIVDVSPGGTTKEDLVRYKSGFHPFLSGPGGCIGRHIAMMEMTLIIARTLHRLDVRRAPGSTLGGGRPGLGWGATDKTQLHVEDAYVSLRCGPEVQFRKRIL
ncbi:benzoate 4-monooxygenase cytochrome P450 [Daldinia vernicosa]|uniref:benzoate 4-monooxygenase cytochrome P450 n=1 Tax=Daldinia vernicosa TaxID=114800 RepID=UPI002008610C|nr:benzoate 4-monooxygenase cytochrome P450 [Daldinia vernicosa]KAI0849863.1 benzoate 4-monooxygenase cytochrome P450 [Daldinia vernicosa]